MIELKIDTVYCSRHNGLVEYKGTDRYRGETTFVFRRMSDGCTSYILPSELDAYLAKDRVPMSSIGHVKHSKQVIHDAVKAGMAGIRVLRDDALPGKTIVASPDVFDMLHKGVDSE